MTLQTGTYVHHQDGLDAFVIASNSKAALLMTKNARSFAVLVLPRVTASGDVASTSITYLDRASWRLDYITLQDAVNEYTRVTKSLSA